MTDRNHGSPPPAKIVVGPLEPATSAGLLPVLEASFTLIHVGDDVDPFHYAERARARAVVVQRSVLADQDFTTLKVTAYGVSSRSWDVLAVAQGRIEHLANPTPAEIVARISEEIDPNDR